ncbi:ABC transporter transmembrane domain-containing protein [Actinokineospora guangxiensis]|uniref:ABC transporter transmembrane domain-containing protein n=1 Tax=Actinokineospora guangxiensis TaxID=1490288 RepID=A0ABW0EGZ1_9PSEU
MRDFPTDVSDFPGGPPTGIRSPSMLLGWLIRRQVGVLAATAGAGMLWQLPTAVGPFVVGRAIDEGIVGGSAQRLLSWLAVLLGVILVGGAGVALWHSLIVRSQLITIYSVTKLVTRKSTQLGHVLNQRVPTGEVVNVSSSDASRYGSLMDVVARAVVAAGVYAVVSVIMLSASVTLGLLALVAAPLLLVFGLPLLRPLHRAQTVEREQESVLTTTATDIVGGLRVLRGIGGEDAFARRYAEQSQRVGRSGVVAGTWQVAVDAIGVLLSGAFLVAMAWVGVHEVRAGRVSIGQLVSFLGYGLLMVTPIRTFFELAQTWVGCVVSARKTLDILAQEPPWADVAEPKELPARADVHDERTGFTAPAGALTVVVDAHPADAIALADRLGKYLPADSGQDPGEPSATNGAWGARVGSVDLSETALTEVRRTVLVNDTASAVLSGTLQEVIDPHGALPRTRAEAALHAAAADDVYRSLPGGWQGLVDERGRSLSGGQRQRLVLARALAEDPEVLVLVEPTSSVDAHTEAVMARRLALWRRGRTTVVMASSPLVLHHADHVVFMAGGRVVAAGTHDELVATSGPYRDVVARTAGEDGA